MPTQEKIFELYIKLLAARNRRQQSLAVSADAYRLNRTGPAFEQIQAELRAALCEYHNLGMEWLALVGLKPQSYGGEKSDGHIAGYHAPCFEECTPTP